MQGGEICCVVLDARTGGLVAAKVTMARSTPVEHRANASSPRGANKADLPTAQQSDIDVHVTLVSLGKRFSSFL
jgi:hypothetical protein